MNTFICIIPARYASTRFPGKPLVFLGEKTIIQRVYEQVSKVIDHVYVATDDERIYEEVQRFHGNVVMTSTNHRSGTDRIEEAMQKIGGHWDVVINVQGDEPFIQPSQITTLCSCFNNDDTTQIATLGKPFTDMYAVENSNSPKIVVDNQGFAMYFSRSMIPFVRGFDKKEWLQHYPFLKHLGIYAYRTEVLHQITQLSPSSLEVAESLEQLRWLQNGYRVKVGITHEETIGIDTPEDLERAKRWLKEEG